MKRSTFLGTTGAAVLAGCSSGGHVLPGVSSTTSGAHPSTSHALQLVPATANPVPANVLGSPIVGEAWRFDGKTAPAGWLLMEGQALPIDSYKALFSVLGHIPGDKGTTTFSLPNPGYGIIIAATGVIPANPTALARMRTISRQASLGPGARPAMPKPPATPSPQTNEARRLLAAAIVPKSSSPVAVPAAVTDAIERTRADASTTAVTTLTSSSRAVLDAVVSAAVDGRTTLYEAVLQVARALNAQEAASVLAVNDRRQQSFSTNGVAVSHANPAREAANFLVSSAITPEQAAIIAQRE